MHSLQRSRPLGTWQPLPRGSGQAFREERQPGCWAKGWRLAPGSAQGPRMCVSRRPPCARLPPREQLCWTRARARTLWGWFALQAPVQTGSPSPHRWSGLTLLPGARGQGHQGGTPGRPSLCPDGCSGAGGASDTPRRANTGHKLCRVLGPLPGRGRPCVWPGDCCEVTVFLRNLSSPLRAASHSHPGSGAPAVPPQALHVPRGSREPVLGNRTGAQSRRESRALGAGEAHGWVRSVCRCQRRVVCVVMCRCSMPLSGLLHL